MKGFEQTNLIFKVPNQLNDIFLVLQLFLEQQKQLKLSWRFGPDFRLISIGQLRPKERNLSQG